MFDKKIDFAKTVIVFSSKGYFMIRHHIQNQLLTIILDNPKSLNALTTSMVKDIHQLLKQCRHDDNIKAIVLMGNDKAFCAGGDIRSLYHAINANPPNMNAIQDFFEHEYALIYALHHYPKPTISLGSGIVMGGGLGLHSACQYKITTNSSLLAMPEVSIGLFPDAGGSYFLNRMMGRVGLFLGLTGARFDGADAYHLKLSDFMIDAQDQNQLLEALYSIDWTKTQNTQNAIQKTLNHHHQEHLTHHSQILRHLSVINWLMNAGDLLAVDGALKNYMGNSNYIKNAIAQYLQGSATTIAITWQIYHTVAPLSLLDILKLELNIALACCRNGEFAEGVRALLIDKDRNPKWRYTLAQLPQDHINAHFVNPNYTHPFDNINQYL